VAVGLDPRLVAVPCADQGAGVVVDAQDVEGHRDGRLVTLFDEGPVGHAGGVAKQVGGIGAVEHRSDEGPVGERVDPAYGIAIGVTVRGCTQHVEVECYRQRGVGRTVPDHPSGESVREVEVVDGGQGGRWLGSAGRVHA
jgi:hypothetical protein